MFILPLGIFVPSLLVFTLYPRVSLLKEFLHGESWFAPVSDHPKPHQFFRCGDALLFITVYMKSKRRVLLVVRNGEHGCLIFTLTHDVFYGVIGMS